MTSSAILTINLGGTSVKLAAVAMRRDGLQTGEMRQIAIDAADEAPAAVATRVRELARSMVADHPGRRWRAVAHRVVHGGPHAPAAARYSPMLRERIATASALAPLHNPHALAVLDAVAQWSAEAWGPDIPQIAVFDTGFFASLPEVARRYALPAAVAEAYGLYRCGFHGLAHAALARHASERCAGGARRIATLQLGSGASIAAIRDGMPMDVSMGFSTLEGLVMGSRCGDLDPGALLHLLRCGYAPERLPALLSEQSGLLGLSGRSSRLDALLAASDPASAFAVAMYVYRARKYLGSFLAVLGGIDAVVFGGGVGEHSPPIRERILAGLEFAGIALDADANAAAVGGTHEIGACGAARVFTTSVDEARELATAALAVIATR